MKYQIGQSVWIWRGDKDEPYTAMITGCLGKSSTGDYVYEFNGFNGVFRFSSGCAEYDIYETQEEAENAYNKFLNQ